jgi:5-methylcytosine-specific restriction endonuclease McrA
MDDEIIPRRTKKANKFKQMLYNTKFLQIMIEQHGELHCEFCGKKGLKLYHWKYDKIKNYDDMATVDHFLPISEYPELAKEHSNLKVCCHECNQEKKDDIWDISTLKFPY